MMKMIKALIVVVTYVSWIVTFFIALVFRFKHPELTETQLIIIYAQKYWYNFVLLIISYFILSNWKRNDYK